MAENTDIVNQQKSFVGANWDPDRIHCMLFGVEGLSYNFAKRNPPELGPRKCEKSGIERMHELLKELVLGGPVLANLLLLPVHRFHGDVC